MRTKEEMYNFCAQYSNKGLVGLPYACFPLPWLAKMNFKVIERNLMKNEEVILAFMALADLRDFDNHGMNGNQSNDEQYKRVRHWVAFGFTNRGYLYYGKWRLLSSDSGSVPISSTKDMNFNLNEHPWPYSSSLDIETLRRNLPNLNGTKQGLLFIKTNLYDTVVKLSHHGEGEDGRRTYDQSVPRFNFDNDSGDNQL